MGRVCLILGLAALLGCGNGLAPRPSLLIAEQRFIVEFDGLQDEGQVEADYEGKLHKTGGPQMVFSAGDGVTIEDLLSDPRFRRVEPDYTGSSPEGTPSGAAILGGDLIASISAQPSLQGVGLFVGGAGGEGVTVAVLDSGVDFTHPYLAEALLPDGYDFVDDDPDPSESRNGLDEDGDGVADELYGHGTFVASLIRTVAPGARILPVRTLDDEGYGRASTLAMGIHWAIDQGARVISVSIDLPASSSIVRSALERAEANGVLVVSSAGNESQPNVESPAREETVLAIAALDATWVAAPFTNYGNRIALSAPGVELIGAYPLDASPMGTARWSGTSFAAPLVAGGAALLAATEPGLPASEARSRIQAATAPVDVLNPELAGALGAGVIDFGLLAVR